MYYLSDNQQQMGGLVSNMFGSKPQASKPEPPVKEKSDVGFDVLDRFRSANLEANFDDVSLGYTTLAKDIKVHEPYTFQVDHLPHEILQVPTKPQQRKDDHVGLESNQNTNHVKKQRNIPKHQQEVVDDPAKKVEVKMNPRTMRMLNRNEKREDAINPEKSKKKSQVVPTRLKIESKSADKGIKPKSSNSSGKVQTKTITQKPVALALNPPQVRENPTEKTPKKPATRKHRSNSSPKAKASAEKPKTRPKKRSAADEDYFHESGAHSASHREDGGEWLDDEEGMTESYFPQVKVVGTSEGTPVPMDPYMPIKLFYWNPCSVNSGNEKKSMEKKILISKDNPHIIMLDEPFCEYRIPGYTSVPGLALEGKSKIYTEVLFRKELPIEIMLVDIDLIIIKQSISHPRNSIYYFCVYLSHTESRQLTCLDLILKWLAKLKGENPLFVLVGDFNTNLQKLEVFSKKDPSTSKLNKLLKDFSLVAARDMHHFDITRTREKRTGGTVVKEKSRIDWLLSTRTDLNIECKFMEESAKLSDHFAFLIKVALL